MTLLQLLNKTKHAPRRAAREILYCYDLVRLWLANRFNRRTVTHPGNPVLSMTTWAKRIDKVYMSIESIATGNILPSRLILWIDDETLLKRLPSTLRRLQRRGLEIKLCNSYGPHTKYYPYIESASEFTVPLVTADDDTIYPRDWLRKLIDAHIRFPALVNCWLTNLVMIDDRGLRPFSEWARVGSELPSFQNLPVGCSGNIYPPALLQSLKDAGVAFQVCCPKADDLWLHVIAIRRGIRIRQIHSRPPYLTHQRLVPGTQRCGLYHANLFQNGNDAAARLTYTPADIEAIRIDILANQGCNDRVKRNTALPFQQASASLQSTEHMSNERARRPVVQQDIQGHKSSR